METALENQIRETFDAFINELSSISEEALNTIPYEGSWTAGQLAEHVLKCVVDLPDMLNADAEQANRPADQKVAQIKSIFLDYSTKMQAPVFVLPSAAPHDKAALIIGLQQVEQGLVRAALKLDISVLCTAFEFPTLGYLTRLEWLTFAAVHTKRHLEQLKRIHTSLALKI